MNGSGANEVLTWRIIFWVVLEESYTSSGNRLPCYIAGMEETRNAWVCPPLVGHAHPSPGREGTLLGANFKMRVRVVVKASQRVSTYRTTMDPNPLIPNH